jgi:hypothetical protein
MFTLILSHFIVGVLGFAMGWAMLNRKQKNSDEQLDRIFAVNLSALKNELTRSQFISSN